MRKIESTFETMIGAYHTPVDFVAQVDALVQALRNATFFLQSKKSDIEDFDKWYRPWQEMMQKDHRMLFVKNMRNKIVKQGINTAKSHALILLLTDYRQTLFQQRFNIFATTDEMKEEVAKLTKKKPSL